MIVFKIFDFMKFSKLKKGDNSVNMLDRVMGIVSYDGDVDSEQLF